MSQYKRASHAPQPTAAIGPNGGISAEHHAWGLTPRVWPARCGPDPSRADLTPSVQVGADPMHGGERVCTGVCELRRMPRPPRKDYQEPRTTCSFAPWRDPQVLDATDYEHALTLLERATSRFELQCHAWCYLPNHSHLLVTSRLGNLSRAMHWLGTCTAQSFNHRHERYGHLYQGRFGSRLVEDDAYLLELARYLPLNPVRAGLCDTPEAWPGRLRRTAGLRECRVP